MDIAGRGDPEPFEAWRGKVGCLLVHGFPGSPAEMRELGAYLAERDLSVIAPLLPGHGEQPKALYGVRWHDWLRAAAAELRRLQNHCDWVFAAGLSMGAALSLYLAGEIPLAGVIALSPAVKPRNRLLPLIPLAQHFLRWIELGEDHDLSDPSAVERQWYYTRVPASSVAEMYHVLRNAWRLAPRVRVPVLLVQGKRDGVLHPEGAQLLFDRLGSAEKTLHWYEDAGHNIVVDAERRQVFADVHSFIDHLADS